MKKVSAALLCTVLFLALLPFVVPPAQMVSDFIINTGTKNAKVGDVLFWSVSEVSGEGSYLYSFEIHMNTPETIRYDTFHEDPFREVIAQEPGLYRAKVTVYDETAGNEVFGWSEYTTVSLRSPTTITSVEAVSADSLMVSWDPIFRADGYKIWRGSQAEGLDEAVFYTQGTSYPDTGLSSGVQYDYQVWSYNLEGNIKYVSSSASNVRTGVPLAAPEPVLTILSGTSLKLAWEAVENATGYQVYSSPDGAGPYDEIESGVALEFLDTGLPSAVAKYYKVRVYKAIGRVLYRGPFSVVCAGRTLDAPAAPNAETLSSTSIRLNWSPVPGAYACTLWRRLSPTSAESIAYRGTDIVFTDTGLLPDTFYDYSVSAYGVLTGGYEFNGPRSPVRTMSTLPAQGLPGDANNDGSVDILDLVSIIDHIVSDTPCASMANADANEDGEIDILDLVWIIDAIVGG